MKHFLQTTLAMFLGTLGALAVIDAWHAHEAQRAATASRAFDAAQARARQEEADTLREIMQARGHQHAPIPSPNNSNEPNALPPTNEDQVDEAH